MLSNHSKQDVLAFYYDIYINGIKIDLLRKMCVQNITINETEDGADNARINIKDADFIFIEDDIFIEDVPIRIEAGWHDEAYRFEFNGYIATLDIDFPDDGCPVLDIFCTDNTHLMNRKKKKRTWANMSSADVVKLVCAEYGFSVVIENGYDFIIEDSIAQSNQTDIEFLQSLADNESDVFICKLRGNTFYYVQKNLLANPVAELWYKENTRDIISFKPQINKETKQEENEVADITSFDKSVDVGIANDNITDRDVQGESMQTTSSPTSTKRYDPRTDNWYLTDYINNMQNEINKSYEQQFTQSPSKGAEKEVARKVF